VMTATFWVFMTVGLLVFRRAVSTPRCAVLS
jgi:hypothetical protein